MRKPKHTFLYMLFLLLCLAVTCAFLLAVSKYSLSDTLQLRTIVLLNIVFDFILLFGFAALIRRHLSASAHTEEYEQQAYMDAMTQVKNRAAFDLIVENRNPAQYPNLTLIMTDLNTLKLVNDTLGHPAGDKLICSTVRYLKEAFGSIGTIYRYGGDEFILVIESAPIQTVHEARATFEKLIVDHSVHGGLEISVAIGIASRQETLNAGMHMSELLRLADNAMYQRKAMQKNLLNAFQSQHHQNIIQIDAATGILTFSAFKSRVYEAIAQNTVATPYLVNFDLNFFNGYNTLFGWESGNKILQKLTILACNICGENGFCSHADADSFWVFADYPDLDSLVRRITEETRAFQDELGDFLLFPSFGIYRISNRLSPFSDMCSHAINAKNKIKGHLDSLCSVYTSEDQQLQIDNFTLTASLRHALKMGDFLPFFQPKYSEDGTRIIGAEALARWRQKDGTFTTPNGFKDLYEKSGLILSLDWHILEKICIFLRRMLDAGVTCVPVSVNFSRLHVYEDDCAVRICRMVDEYRLPHDLIEIEITESVLVQRAEPLSTLISSIRANGFCVSLDNFGIGFSSLNILKTNTVDTVKIDRSLTAPSDSPERDKAMIGHLVSMCREMHIRTVAEGIETETQLVFMRQFGFDMYQGAHLSPAIPAFEFEALLKGDI